MPVKTYVPTARIIVAGTYKYLTRYQTKLEENLTAPQYTCIVNLISALLECIIALGPTPIEP